MRGRPGPISSFTYVRTNVCVCVYVYACIEHVCARTRLRAYRTHVYAYTLGFVCMCSACVFVYSARAAGVSHEHGRPRVCLCACARAVCAGRVGNTTVPGGTKWFFLALGGIFRTVFSSGALFAHAGAPWRFQFFFLLLFRFPLFLSLAPRS